jgi:hypothetical protein
MKRQKAGLREVVLTWTALITTFFWTSLLRVILKPEISSWRILNIGGKGIEGNFWFLPLVVLLVLFIFYLEGRGKLRVLFYILYFVMHLVFAAVIVYSGLQEGSEISFRTWGITLPIIWLVVPFVIFLILSVVWMIRELEGKLSVPEQDWNKVDRKTILFAAVLFPFAIFFFSIGKGFDLFVKLAIITTLLQWLLLTESLGRRSRRVR